jgi:hypothetical protein
VTQALYQPEKYAPEHHLADQLAALHDLEPCVDIIAWSAHPFISGLLADSFPDDYFDTIFALTKKPQAISESSYPAQEWSLPNSGGTWKGTPQKQHHFVEQMLTKATSSQLQFVVWFAIRDYDQLWSKPVAEGGLGQDTLSLLWRDTGLYDEAGAPREAYGSWAATLHQPWR